MNEYIIGSREIAGSLEFTGIDPEIVYNDIISSQLTYRFIADFSQTGNVVESIRVENSIHKKANLEVGNTYISGRYGKDFNEVDIIVLCESLFERYRQENDVYTIHSSAICKGNKGILLVANLTGAGKTTTALALVKKYGFEIFSDDKTLVSGNKMVGQVRKIYLEEKTRLALNSHDIDVESEININHQSNKEINIIVIPIIIRKSKDTIVRQYTKSQLKWMIYEELSKDIRSVNGMIFDMSDPLMPIDTYEIATRRLQYANKLSNIKCYLIQGDLEAVSIKINSLFQEES